MEYLSFADFEENEKEVQNKNFMSSLKLSTFVFVYFVIKFNLKYDYGRFNFIMIGLLLTIVSIKFILHKLTKNLYFSIFVFYVFFLILSAFLIYLTGGHKAPGSMWLAILPFVGASFLGRRGFFWGAIGLITIFISYFVANSMGLALYPYHSIDAFFVEFRTNLFIFSGFSISLTYSFIKNEQINKQKVLIEKEKNENLLRILFHDLANPMQAIKMLIKKLINNRTPEEAEKIIHQLESYSERVNEVLHHVKKMKAIEDGKISLEMKPYILHDAIKKTEELFEERLKEKQIELRIVNPLSDSQVVMVDHVYFVHQVLGNIISNSIKFSDVGGSIIISWERLGSELFFRITDNGIGIPSEIMANLFKEHKTISRKGTFGEVGTGYGMPIVKTFVEQFHGTIEIQSIEKNGRNKDHGTTTILKFPAV